MSEWVNRRFGPGHVKQCANPDMITCANHICQKRNLCMLMPDEAIVGKSHNQEPVIAQHDAQVEAVARAIGQQLIAITEGDVGPTYFRGEDMRLLARAAIAALSTAAVPPQVPHAGEVERLRAKLQAIIDGDVPRTEGRKWREDGAYSKNDQCSHEIAMYNDCSECTAAFARAALTSGMIYHWNKRPD